MGNVFPQFIICYPLITSAKLERKTLSNKRYAEERCLFGLLLCCIKPIDINQSDITCFSQIFKLTLPAANKKGTREWRKTKNYAMHGTL